MSAAHRSRRLAAESTLVGLLSARKGERRQSRPHRLERAGFGPQTDRKNAENWLSNRNPCPVIRLHPQRFRYEADPGTALLGRRKARRPSVMRRPAPRE